MNSKLISKLLLTGLILLVLSSVGFAQEANTEPIDPGKPKTEAMGEDDFLPFMKTEQSSEMQEPTSGGLLFKTFGALLLIVGLLFFGAWGLRKMGFGMLKPADAADAPELKVLNTASVGSGQTLSVVRFGERILLVGSTSQTFTLLADETGEEVKKFIPEKPHSVADLLAFENNAFTHELNYAENRLETRPIKGGQLQ